MVKWGILGRSRAGSRYWIQGWQRLPSIFCFMCRFERWQIADLLSWGRREMVDGRRPIDGCQCRSRDCGLKEDYYRVRKGTRRNWDREISRRLWSFKAMPWKRNSLLWLSYNLTENTYYRICKEARKFLTRSNEWLDGSERTMWYTKRQWVCWYYKFIWKEEVGRCLEVGKLWHSRPLSRTLLSDMVADL